MWAGGVALAAIVVLLVWSVARRRPEHRPVAGALTVGFTADLARKALVVYVIHPARAASGGAPLAGLARVACDVDNALFLAYPAALIALSVSVFMRRRLWPIAVAYVLAVAGLAVTYPASRGEALARVYMAAELAVVVTTIGALVTWFWRREPPSLTHGVTAMLGMCEIATLIPYRLHLFSSWTIAQASYMTLYVILIALYGSDLWGSGSSSQSKSS
jgi:hypothetical protein